MGGGSGSTGVARARLGVARARLDVARARLMWLGLDLGRRRLRIGASQALLSAAAIASGLVPTALFAVGGGPVALTGMPAPPASGGVLAGRTTEACLGPLGQEPAFTSFEQATSAAGVPAGESRSRSRVVDPETVRGETEDGPREELLPSGQAAGR